MDPTKLRAWWWSRQGLDGRLAGRRPAEVLQETGWARSVGGCNPYLALFARSGISREDADAAIAAVEIHELPSARGCTYVLPAADFALGLAAGQGFHDGDLKIALKLGAASGEIDKLCDAVIKALGKGPLATDGIKQVVGGAVRNFGPEGAKKGVTTTLPIALGQLQARGEIRRVPLNGRLDQQRYRYALWRPNPLTKFKLSREEVHTELARHYFHWAGPATMADFQAFSALGVKAAQAAVAPLKLAGEERLMLPEDRDAFERFQVPKKPQYALVGSIDNISLGVGSFRSLLSKEDEGRKEAQGLEETSGHAIVDRGRLVGLWVYDPATESIAWMSFVAANPALKEAVKRTEDYVRTQLGDARGFGLDSPKSRVPRIEALRKAAARV